MYVAPLTEVKVTRGGSYGGLRRHKGLDLVCASGTPVRAIVGGTYHSSGYTDTHGFWGMWFGDDDNYWGAAHLLRPFDARGRIEAAQIVALSGASGLYKGKPIYAHLHLSVSTRPSLTLGTFDPEPIVLAAPQPTRKKEVTEMELRAVNNGKGTAANPEADLMAIGPTGKTTKLSDEEWAACYRPRYGEGWQTQAEFALEVAVYTRVAPTAVSAAPLSYADVQRIAAEVIRQQKLPGN